MTPRRLLCSSSSSSSTAAEDAAAADPAPVQSPFKLFGLEERFDIDLSALKKRYHTQQGRNHPDKFTGKGREAIHEAADRAAELNDAYTLLTNPCARAQWLLIQHHGIDPLSEQSTINDPALLMEMLSAREEVEGCQESGCMDGLQHRAKLDMAALEAEMEVAFAVGDIQRAATLTVRMQYQRKLAEEVREKFVRLRNAPGAEGDID